MSAWLLGPFATPATVMAVRGCAGASATDNNRAFQLTDYYLICGLVGINSIVAMCSTLDHLLLRIIRTAYVAMAAPEAPRFCRRYLRCIALYALRSARLD